MNKYNSNPIGVFDSGLGGITVLKQLTRIMPNENFIFFGDSQNAPYGTKSTKEILELCIENVQMLIDHGAKAIVIACNTATSVAAQTLRSRFSIPIIGIEPAVKPAAINHPSQKVIVMATPVTLKKEKFVHLMENYRDVTEIIPIPCPGLVEIIEKGIISGKEIDNYLKVLFSPYEDERISAVVLGCTHYPFIADAIRNSFDYSVDIVDGALGTAKETRRKIEEHGIGADANQTGSVRFMSSLNTKEEIELMKKMYEL